MVHLDKCINCPSLKKQNYINMFEIRKWYDERKTVTHVHSFEEAYEAYVNENNCDTVQVYFLKNGSEPILLAQKEV